VGGFGALGFGSIDSITIDRLTLQYSKIMVADFDSLAGGIMSNLDGVLGYDFFVRFPIRINFSDSTLIVYHPDFAPKGASENELPMEIYCQLPIITGILDGQPLRLILDLGAQAGLVVQHNSRGYHQVMEKDTGAAQMTRIAGIGGSRQVHTAIMDSLRIGTVVIPSPEVMALDDFSGFPFPDYIEGVVGVGILKKFGLYMDYELRKFRLETR